MTQPACPSWAAMQSGVRPSAAVSCSSTLERLPVRQHRQAASTKSVYQKLVVRFGLYELLGCLVGITEHDRPLVLI